MTTPTNHFALSSKAQSKLRQAWDLKGLAEQEWALGLAVNSFQPKRARQHFKAAKSIAREVDEICEQFGDKPKAHKKLNEDFQAKLRRMARETKPQPAFSAGGM